MAGWGNKAALPVGTHVHYINGAIETMGKDFNDPSISVEQYEFDVQYQVEGSEEWKSRKLWTKQDFKLWETIEQAKHIPKLMKLVKACGLASPQTQADADAWKPEALVGQYFRIKVEENEDDRFVTMPGVAPGPGAIKGKGAAAPPPAAPKATQAAAPKPPRTAPPPPSTPAPAGTSPFVDGAEDGYE